MRLETGPTPRKPVLTALPARDPDQRLRGRDSNPDFTDQNRTNCHYSTPQRVGIRITVCDRLLCYVEEVIEIRRTALLLLLVVSGAAFIAGCGGDDSSDETAAPVTTTTPETATLTQDELITQGDDLCSSVNDAVGTIEASSTTDESLRASQISQIYTGLADDLSALGTPSDGEAPTDVIDAATALADAESAGGDTSTAATSFADAAAAYGFSDCADAPAAPAGTSSATDPSTSTDSGGSTSTAPTYTPPATTAPAPTAPAPTAPSTGGGAAVPSTGSGGSSGSSSGGISPG